MAMGVWPTQAQSGVAVDVGSKYVNSVLWNQTDRTLVVVLPDLGIGLGAGLQFVMEATLTGQLAAVDWDCQPDTMPSRYLPSECRDIRFP